MARATASGTTIAAVLPISAVAALTYAGLHNVDEPAASVIVPGTAAGVIIGSLLATRVRASVLRGLFHLVLMATAVRLLVALPSGSIHQIAVEVQRGGCPEPRTHLQAVVHRLAHRQQATARPASASPPPSYRWRSTRLRAR
jgi:Sulfite exporter TauE/SafE